VRLAIMMEDAWWLTIRSVRVADSNQREIDWRTHLGHPQLFIMWISSSLPTSIYTFALLFILRSTVAQNLDDDLETSIVLPLPTSSLLTKLPISQPPIAIAVSSPSSFAPKVLQTPVPLGVAITASGKPIPCSPKNTKLNPSTHKLISECTEQMFCTAPPGSPPNATGLGMCFPRLCRRDQFPFGYGHYGGGNAPPKIRVKGKLMFNDSAVVLPPVCGDGMFCPDNGSGCRQRSDLGAKCELGRDEQCATPPAAEGVPIASDKAVCLNLTCRFVGQPSSASGPP